MICCGAASPAHWSLQSESPAHDSEHEPVQRNVHVEPPSQLMLPLGPAVMSHVEPPLQLTLHDEPHAPEQLFWSLQPSVQLDPLHPESPISHVSPAVHEHDEPVHSGAEVLLPQPPRKPRKRRNESDRYNDSPGWRMNANIHDGSRWPGARAMIVFCARWHGDKDRARVVADQDPAAAVHLHVSR